MDGSESHNRFRGTAENAKTKLCLRWEAGNCRCGPLTLPRTSPPRGTLLARTPTPTAGVHRCEASSGSRDGLRGLDQAPISVPVWRQLLRHQSSLTNLRIAITPPGCFRSNPWPGPHAPPLYPLTQALRATFCPHRFGERCNFAHGEHELRRLPPRSGMNRGGFSRSDGPTMGAGGPPGGAYFTGKAFAHSVT